jgi:hypothetical protein
VVVVGGGGGGHLPGRLVEISPRPSGGGGPARLGPSASSPPMVQAQCHRGRTQWGGR